MKLDSFLKSSGRVGTRTRNALLDALLSDYSGLKLLVPDLTLGQEVPENMLPIIKGMVIQTLPSLKCRIRNLGPKCLLLLAEYFQITPASSTAPSSPAVSPISRQQT